jgi:hypothetical protein
MTRRAKGQSGQVMILVAVALLALIGSAALVLLAGNAEWQKNQLQQLADQAALDAALKIGVGCDAGKASTVITEADNFLATQRARTGSLVVGAGSCAAGYPGTDTFSGGLSATINYPYRAHQQQVEVILTLSIPISFGAELGKTNTTLTRRAVAQELPGSVPAVSATSLSCTGGQVNVGGSVKTQNAIVLSGGCALYAHTRFDAASSTYSDLGNVSVYTDGQAWVSGGSCTAGASSGSTNAICADGSELSGHLAPACGTTGTSAFLSAGGAAVNPNPCAAGVARPPVPPRSTLLPPEPNTDAAAIATLQGTGGAACTAAGVYPNIVAGGVTFGTGLAPAPIKDASGFYHFKPSCYGYLTMASLAGGISNRQTGVETAPAKHFINPTLPAASVAGDLLVATLSAADGVNTVTGPAGWTRAATVAQAGEGRNEIWYRANAPAGILTAQWTVLPASIDVVSQMTEWSGVLAAAPLDRTGTLAVAVAATTATISTSAATTQANELVITSDGFKIAAGQSFSSGAGWSSLASDAANGFGSEFRLDLPAAVASETVSTSQASQWSLAVATFKAAAVPSPAILDPGFYYFNGSGFAGGGGICLNGGKLLARDVTLEFVNQAGFSSGTCVAGGGAACTGACGFGSTPCSISACPPNAALDPASGGGFTWFASPCSQAPTGDASCPGSAWCTAGDRACSNLLIWAPVTNTGQVALKGSAVSVWLLGSVYWPGTCTDSVNGTSTIDGAVSCNTLSISAGVGAGTAVGSDFGISTALAEAILVE